MAYKKILIACEESQSVCMEFRKLGFSSFSCDILPCSGGYPDYHIQDDIFNVLGLGWDLMIAFPPCTHLAVSGARHFEQKRKDGRQQQGIDFFLALVNAPIKMICIENPIGVMSNIYRKPDQIIQPYQFGYAYKKSTCLWLKNLPCLMPSNIVDPVFVEYHSKKNKSGKSKYSFMGTFSSGGNELARSIRSKTPEGIAKAMAAQWSKLLID